MKKRFITLFMALLLALSCALPAFAAGLDLDVIRSGEDVYAYESELEGINAYTTMSILEDMSAWNEVSDGLLTVISPFVGVTDDEAGFGIEVSYYTLDSMYPRSLNFDEMTVTAGGTSYTFSRLICADSTLVDGVRGVHAKCFMVKLDAESLALMEQLTANREGPIRVTLRMEDQEWSFALSQHEIDSLIHLYNLYVLAGGLSSENLSAFPAGSGTACKISAS